MQHHQQQEPAKLTSLDEARALLLEALQPLEPELAPLDAALGCICAAPVIANRHPRQVIALRDGWAMRANDLVGASSYAPVMLTQTPVAVEAGEALPPDCDCVIDPHGVDLSGPFAQVVIEAAPGLNVRRPGEDAGEEQALIGAGRPLRALDLACAAELGLTHIAVRRPQVAIVDAPHKGAGTTSRFLLQALAQAGASATLHQAADRSADALAAALPAAQADLVLLLGGTGSGASDHAIEALRHCGGLRLHGVALDPGRTCAIGNVSGTPIIALPGRLEQTLGSWLGLVTPALDRLTLRQKPEPQRLALTQKIASRVGVAEVALLRREADRLTPLAVGDLPLQCLCAATHAMIISAGDEGHAGGDHVEAVALAGAG